VIRVCIDVPDLERAIEFYERGLGLRLGRRLKSGWAEMLGATSPIDLLEEKAGTRPTAAPGTARDYIRHWTPVHIDFQVADLERAVERARSACATIERGTKTTAWGQIAVLADPFGNGLCLVEMRGRGYDEILSAEPSRAATDRRDEDSAGPPNWAEPSGRPHSRPGKFARLRCANFR